ncbi:uncharacterized protein LOC106647131 [Copidosoma floridanum]|uniref:uncharacterized protein LOC106647131 n=1 Tax=Copidosoma floridanum TaxID=29053 RepID=UPI0006C9ACE5|nr:uncharacterized protein LOC106647131 [Copidosoma floridanum]XP_014218879.1 uncharacterized protein LOC106647131 [Copidosoma floridanum]XP_014218880.1 uncharacterized protein LOC106647131 [Copidosoma floridanum]
MAATPALVLLLCTLVLLPAASVTPGAMDLVIRNTANGDMPAGNTDRDDDVARSSGTDKSTELQSNLHGSMCSRSGNKISCDCKNDEKKGLSLELSKEQRSEPSSRYVKELVVENCASVRLGRNALTPMQQLKSVNLTNIGALVLEPYSFNLSAQASDVQLTINSTRIDTLPSNVYDGSIQNIKLTNVRLGYLAAYSFSNLRGTSSIVLTNCDVAELSRYAFRRFEVRVLHVNGGTFGQHLVPEHAFNDVVVPETFVLNGVRMGTLESSAFAVEGTATLVVKRCRIGRLEPAAFNVTVAKTVLFTENSLGTVEPGAFEWIRAADPDGTTSRTFKFKANNLTDFGEGSLGFDRHSFDSVELANLLVNQSCDCDSLATWRRRILGSVDVVDSEAALSCLAGDGQPVGFAEYEARGCVLGSSLVVLLSVIGGLLVVLAGAGCLAVHLGRRWHRHGRKTSWSSLPMSTPDVVSNKSKNGFAEQLAATGSQQRGGAPLDSKVTMIVPDGRLYRETEIHVVVEKVEPLTTEL